MNLKILECDLINDHSNLTFFLHNLVMWREL